MFNNKKNPENIYKDLTTNDTEQMIENNAEKLSADLQFPTKLIHITLVFYLYVLDLFLEVNN